MSSAGLAADQSVPADRAPSRLVSTALGLAKSGVPVFPCAPSKRPLTHDGYKAATTDPAQVAKWWADHPGALVGVPTGSASRLLVIDIDPDGAEWYADHAMDLRAGRVHRTRRGHHLIYRIPVDRDIRCSAGRIAPGVDVRAEGGYIVWWPAAGLEAVGDMDDIVEPPGWLLERLSEQARQVQQMDGSIPEGRRHISLMSLAGSLRRRGMTGPEIESALAAVNARCDPPLPNAEVRRMAADCGEYPASERAVVLADFRAYMPDHRYIFMPTRELWPASSVDARIEWPDRPDGKTTRPSRWLDANAAVEQMTWAPGLPMLIEDRLIDTGGWVGHKGVTVFNLYRPPSLEMGNPDKAGPWLDHLNYVYPDHAEHIVRWLAQRIQRPDDKLNHALVLGGKHGIGKDTLLEPAKHAVGPWNFQEVSPASMLGRFNGFVKSVILRVSEARDLGDVDRFAFYDHTKALIAAPPDVLRVDEKNIREYSVPNVTGVIITTNHKTNGLYLPADDRRHYVAWSALDKDRFDPGYWNHLWGWYHENGIAHVAAYLSSLDLHDFDAKAPPPKTEAFWHVVNAARAPEESELADILDSLQWPQAVTLEQMGSRARAKGMADFADWLEDRRQRTKLPHRFEAVGYEPVRNSYAKDGLWVINGKRQTIYAKTEVSLRERLAAAERMTQ